MFEILKYYLAPIVIFIGLSSLFKVYISELKDKLDNIEKKLNKMEKKVDKMEKILIIFYKNNYYWF